MSDTDRALKDAGIRATRYVDDFRLFLGSHQDPYEALALLAEHLAVNEGLSLNTAKTRVYTRARFLKHLDEVTTDFTEQAEGIALESLTADLYFDEEMDPAKLEELRNMNLLGFLEQEISREAWDVGRIRVIFRALKIAQPTEAIDYIIREFERMIMFSKEMCLLMDALDPVRLGGQFNGLVDTVIDAILRPPASSVQLIRTWLLEIFVRGIIDISNSKLRRLDALVSPLDRRQLLLIRGRQGDKNYFRKQKTGLDERFSTFEQSCVVWGASCLPKDEFESWIAFVKPIFSRPAGVLFLSWANSKKSDLILRLESGLDEHPD